MGPGVLLREAWRNLTGRWVRSLGAIALISLLFIGSGWVEAQAIHEARRDLADSHRRGASVLTVTAAPGLVPGNQCVAAQSGSAVEAGGSVTERRIVSSALLPRDPFQLVSYTGDIASVYQGEPLPPGRTYAGALLAQQLGLAPGSSLELVGGQRLRIDGVLDPSERVPGVDRWLLVPVVDGGDALECALDVSPLSVDVVAASLPAQFVGTPAVEVTTANRTTSASDIVRRFDARNTQWASLIAGFGAALIAAGATVLRRREFALYGVCGLSTTQTLAMGVVEASLLFLGAASVSVSALITIGVSPTVEFSWPTVQWGLLTITVAWAVSMVASPFLTALATAGRTSSLLKDRN